MTNLFRLLVLMLIAFARSGALSAKSDEQLTTLTMPDEDQATQSVYDGKRMLRVTGYSRLHLDLKRAVKTIQHEFAMIGSSVKYRVQGIRERIKQAKTASAKVDEMPSNTPGKTSDGKLDAQQPDAQPNAKPSIRLGKTFDGEPDAQQPDAQPNAKPNKWPGLWHSKTSGVKPDAQRPDAQPSAKPSKRFGKTSDGKPDAKPNAKPNKWPGLWHSKTSGLKPDAQHPDAQPSAKPSKRFGKTSDGKPDAKSNAQPNEKPSQRLSKSSGQKLDAKPNAQPDEKSGQRPSKTSGRKSDAKFFFAEPDAKPSKVISETATANGGGQKTALISRIKERITAMKKTIVDIIKRAFGTLTFSI
uniref:Uncharacterized protein n=1 Tax=Peronospora matthiolae TaxID=2874970 RepID=A0AAV1U6J1_9STRA